MDPSDHDERDLGNGASDGGHGLTHANGGPPGDEGWLRSVLENSSEVVKVLDPDGTLRYASPAFGRVFGYDPGEAVGKMNVLDYVHPEDLPHVLEETERALSEGGAVSSRTEYRFRHADGSWRWVEGVGTYLPEDPAVGGVVVNARDITERKEVERRLSAVISNAHAYAYRCLNEPGWPNEYASEYALDLTGYPPEDLLAGGKVGLGDLIVEADRKRVWDEVQQALAEDRGFELRYSIRRRDGQVRHVHEYGQGVPVEDGGVVALEGLIYDITDHTEAEEALKKAEERYRSLVERVPAIVYVQEPSEPSRTTYVSPQNEAILGYSPEECLADPDHWVKILHPADRQRVLDEDARSNRNGDSFTMEYRQFAKDGRVVWVRDDATLVRDEKGEPLYWLGVQTDVTESRLTETKLREAEARYRSLVERVPVAIYRQEIDHDGVVSYISPQIEAITGYAPKEYADPNLWVRTMHPDDRQRVLDEDERTDGTGEPFMVEFRKFARDGRLVWLRDEAVLVRDEAGEPLYWQGMVQDVTERKALEGRLKHQALHDPLTGLPNRRLFVDRLGQALGRTRRRRSRKVAVLFMDLDGFKTVNDSLGHGVGDLLLVAAAERLRRRLRPEDTLARFGGDEFVVLVEGVEDPDEAVRVAERIAEGFGVPFQLGGRELYASASIGIATGDARTKTPEDLLRDADTAMYRAKDGGLEYSLFDPGMHERAMGRLELENDLRRAIREEEFVVHYQPIVRLDDRSVRGVEALVRWRHPERGLLNPDEFVPVAEESGLVVPMGETVLEEACKRAKGWQRNHPHMPSLVMSVNLSATQLARPDLAETVVGTLGRTGLEARCLSLDVTETVYVKALEANTKALSRLREMGVGVSIDDFGVGYSSLSYLKRLPADALKVDKSFIGGLGEDAEDTAIVGMVIELAHTLGMEVVAEGVETEGQAELLREMGCDFGQGYFYSKPLPPEDMPEFLEGRPS